MNNDFPASYEHGRTQQRGIDARLKEVQEFDQLFGQSAITSISRLLTLNGHVPFEQAIESLTPTERYFLNMIQSQQHLCLRPFNPSHALPDHSCLVIQEHRVGHVSILLPEEVDCYQRAQDLFVVGVVQLHPDQFRLLADYNRAYRALFEAQGQEIFQSLCLLEQAGELCSVILQIRDTLMHMAPIVVYVWHRIYSTFDQAGKNLVDIHPREDGERILSVLLRQPVVAWSVEDRTFVYGFYLLLKSGGPYRLEEMNSSQISLDTLHTFINEKAQVYAQHLKHPLPNTWASLPIWEKACWLSEQRPRIDEDFQRYRFIHGIDLRKRERLIKRPPLETQLLFHSRLIKIVQKVFGLVPLEGELRQEYWRRITWEILKQESMQRQQEVPLSADDPRARLFALLIWIIVQDVTEATNSDIGMSSFLRSVAELATTDLSMLQKPDFYCCVVPSLTLAAKEQQEERLSEILRMIGARMQFNRWHFIVSNMRHEDIPVKRNWFYAPTIPDIAIWSDQHHAGHVQASVRHSIRYPAPLCLFGKQFTGVYDIRLMRQEGPAYTTHEMMLCADYVVTMGYVLQTIGEYVKATQEAITIDIFDAAWYKRTAWKHWLKSYTNL